MFKKYPPKYVYVSSSRLGCSQTGEFDEGYEYSTTDVEVIEITGNQYRTLKEGSAVVTVREGENKIGVYIIAVNGVETVNLKNINLPSVLESVNGSAFDGSGIEKIELPDSVTVVGMHAFRGCYNLKEVKLCLSPKALSQLQRVKSNIIKLREIFCAPIVSQLKMLFPLLFYAIQKMSTQKNLMTSAFSMK